MILRGFIRRLFTRNTFASNVAKLASGNTIGQLSIVLVSPLLTRFFTPEIFGSFQFILSSAAILAVISTLRYEMALPLSNTRIQARNLFKLSVTLLLTVTIAIVLLLTFIPDLSIIHDNLTELGPLVYLIAPVMLGEGMISIFNQWFIREERYAISGGSRSIFGISTALSQLIIGITRMTTLLGLTAGYLIGQIFSFIFFLRNFLVANSKGEPGESEPIITTAKKFRSFPLFSSWNTLLNTIGRNLPIILIGAHFLNEQLGFFAIALRALGFPMTTLGMSIGQVYYRQIAKFINLGFPILPFLVGTAAKVLLIMILPMLILYLWGEELFGVVFGQNWAAAGRIVQILAP
ncbi:MAG: oligosaccharide flippase family protein, partial [Fidelibacterota bacterium]